MHNWQKVMEHLKVHGSITYRYMYQVMKMNSPRDVMSDLRKHLKREGMFVPDDWDKNDDTGKRYKIFYKPVSIGTAYHFSDKNDFYAMTDEGLKPLRRKAANAYKEADTLGKSVQIPCSNNTPKTGYIMGKGKRSFWDKVKDWLK